MGFFDKLKEGLGKSKINAVTVCAGDCRTYFYDIYDVVDAKYKDNSTILTFSKSIENKKYAYASSKKEVLTFYKFKILDGDRTIEIMNNNRFSAKKICLIIED